ncbi:MAG TPA: HEAT repeat domain-containing protein [Pyrinomonadaceae bacterium]|nr:HEAT repeat domain-containing protein [Pyrinomonadaceae bacterium]
MVALEEDGIPVSVPDDWVKALLTGLVDQRSTIREFSLSALNDIAPQVVGRDDVTRGIVTCLYDDFLSVRNRAVYVAGAFCGPELLAALLDSLHELQVSAPASDDADKSGLWHALFALDTVLDRTEVASAQLENVAQLLLTLIHSVSPSEIDIWKIGDSLGDHVKGPAAFRALELMSQHADDLVRRSAIHGLGHIGGSEAQAIIRKGLSGSSESVREEARRALSEMSSQESV